jgi:hypothetical protein
VGGHPFSSERVEGILFSATKNNYLFDKKQVGAPPVPSAVFGGSIKF